MSWPKSLKLERLPALCLRLHLTNRSRTACHRWAAASQIGYSKASAALSSSSSRSKWRSPWFAGAQKPNRNGAPTITFENCKLQMVGKVCAIFLLNSRRELCRWSGFATRCSFSPLASWPAARHVLGIPSNRKDSERTQRWQQCGRYFFFSGSQLESSSIMIDKFVLWIFHKLGNSCAIEGWRPIIECPIVRHLSILIKGTRADRLRILIVLRPGSLLILAPSLWRPLFGITHVWLAFGC